MADFINTIDALGDDAVVDSIINRTITEFKDDLVTGIGYYTGSAGSAKSSAFENCTSLREVDVPNASSIGPGSFKGCTNLVSINAPLVQIAGDSAFNGCLSLIEIKFPNLTRTTSESASGSGMFASCTSLRKADFTKVTDIGGRAFVNCTSLTALILRSETLCALRSTTSFNGTPIASGTGYIYVPSALVDSYLAATNWSTFANKFRGIFEDEDVLQGIADGTLVDLYSDTLTAVPIRGCCNYTNLEIVYSPNVVSVGSCAFQGCSSLKVADLGRISGELPPAAFTGCSNLVAVAIRSDAVPTLRWVGNDWANTFRYCNKLSEGDGYFYVPRALIEDYKEAPNWSTYATQFRALEDYTVDGTITGELDESKI